MRPGWPRSSPVACVARHHPRRRRPGNSSALRAVAFSPRAGSSLLDFQMTTFKGDATELNKPIRIASLESEVKTGLLWPNSGGLIFRISCSMVFKSEEVFVDFVELYAFEQSQRRIRHRFRICENVQFS